MSAKISSFYSANKYRERLLMLAAVIFFLSGCSLLPKECSQDPACIRVLFIGNSYTMANDLPTVFKNLAEVGGKRVETGIEAEGGWTLARHEDSAATIKQIQSSKWNYIVLQEQSQIPASLTERENSMYPSSRLLVKQIRETGAEPIFFVTWAHRVGWPESGIVGYTEMQLLINGGYLNIAQELKAKISPVGYAWLAAHRQHPELNLWQEDGTHPDEKGTYLAACVFYAAIFKSSPEGLSYTGSLPKEEATILQKIAGETVLNNLSKWNLK